MTVFRLRLSVVAIASLHIMSEVHVSAAIICLRAIESAKGPCRRPGRWQSRVIVVRALSSGTCRPLRLEVLRANCQRCHGWLHTGM